MYITDTRPDRAPSRLPSLEYPVSSVDPDSHAAVCARWLNQVHAPGERAGHSMTSGQQRLSLPSCLQYISTLAVALQSPPKLSPSLSRSELTSPALPHQTYPTRVRCNLSRTSIPSSPSFSLAPNLPPRLPRRPPALRSEHTSAFDPS